MLGDKVEPLSKGLEIYSERSGWITSIENTRLLRFHLTACAVQLTAIVSCCRIGEPVEHALRHSALLVKHVHPSNIFPTRVVVTIATRASAATSSGDCCG